MDNVLRRNGSVIGGFQIVPEKGYGQQVRSAARARLRWVNSRSS